MHGDVHKTKPKLAFQLPNTISGMARARIVCGVSRVHHTQPYHWLRASHDIVVQEYEVHAHPNRTSTSGPANDVKHHQNPETQ